MSWTEQDNALHREIKTKNFLTSFSMVAVITPLAEQANHHPDLAFGWGYLSITLTTHDAGGVTEKDWALAKQIDTALAPFGA